MKILKLEERTSKNKSINKKKLLITASIIFIILLCCILFAVYVANPNFRAMLDQYVFRKNISSENVPFIPISSDDAGHIFAYDNYIALLNKTTLTSYSSSGKKEFEVEVLVNNPIYDSNNRFLCLAEQNGQKLYLLSGQTILWQKDVEGQIAKVSVNKNGYVSVIITGTSYKTIVVTYSPEGEKQFTTYLSRTIAVDISMSTNNKYLAIAEVNTSGSSIQSNIRIISTEEASSHPNDAIKYMYPANAGQLISKIEYQDKEKLICLYHDSIHMIQNNQDAKLADLDIKKDLFSDISLKEHFVRVTEKSSGLFADIQAQIVNISSKKENIYTVTGVPKSVKCYETIIALNLGTEIHFIDTNGWLIKKYSSKQEVKDIVITSNIAGIIYQDKIEVIRL